MKRQFDEMKREHPMIDIDFIEKVYNAIAEMSQQHKDVTLASVAKKLHVEKKEIINAKKWLTEYHLIKARGEGVRVVFFKITHKNSDVNFLYGREKIDVQIKRNMELIKESIDKDKFKKLIKQRDENFGQFLTSLNALVEENWKRANSNELVKIELSSKAIRYEAC